jgi:ABC-type multidrug transport system fused ATPase/permease subunit
MHPIMSIGRIINIVQRGNASGKRLADILKRSQQLPEGRKTCANAAEKLEVRDLTFTFPGADKPALGAYFFLRGAGKTLGIIGHTGSGKRPWPARR